MEKYDLIVFTSGPGAYGPKRLKEEAEKLGKKFVILEYKNVDIFFGKNGYELKLNGASMPKSKSILLRGLGEDSIYNPLKVALIDWYKKNGSKVLNYQSFKTWPSLDKITQHLGFVENGIPTVESFEFGCEQDLRDWAKNNYPFIAKDTTGSCGKNVFKINDLFELDGLSKQGYLNNVRIKTLLFQKFLKAGEDIRVIILGDKILGGMKRIAKEGKYLTNYSQGGDVVSYDIENDKTAKEIALKVAKTFYLDYCGVDLMKDNAGNWIVLEVNRACQFEGFEKVNDVNVAKETIEFLEN